jgi:transcriptional regulator with XRE-family HTH domain
VERFAKLDRKRDEAKISTEFDSVALGRWIRHYRKAKGMTLDQLAKAVDASPSHLSLIETGQREARVAMLSKIATTLEVPVSSLMSPPKADRRTELTISLEHAQRSDLYSSLALRKVRVGPSLPTDALELVFTRNWCADPRSRQPLPRRRARRMRNFVSR